MSMKRKLFVLASIMSCFVSVKAQTPKILFDFEEPALETTYWSESNNAISLDREHVREGSQALKWELKAGAKLVLNYVSSTRTSNISSDRMMYIPIYCSKPSKDILVVSLYKDATKIAEGRHDLNYQGWLPFQRYIKTDFGSTVLSTFNRVEISYQPQNSGNNQMVWLDGVCSAGSNSGPTAGKMFYISVLGPQAMTDYRAGYFSPRPNLSTYYMEAFSRQKGADDALPISDSNKSEVDNILAKYTRINVKPFSAQLANAMAFVEARNIVETADGGINASSAWWVYTPAEAATCGNYVASLAYAAINGANQDAKANLLKLTRYMLDYGMSPGGGEVGMLPSNYTASRDFAKGFLYAMPIYDEYDRQHPNAGLKKRVFDLLSWCYNYGYIYGNHSPELLTLDQVHVKVWSYFNLASLFPTTESRAGELKLITRFLERIVAIQSGREGIIRPDGVGFHHKAMHNAYMYGFQSWIDHVANLKGTSFRIGASAFQDVRLFAKTYFKQCVATGDAPFYSNAQCGRGAFNLIPGINQSGLEQLAYIGGDIQGKAYDSEVASLCKLFFPSSTFSEVPASLNGFHQMNYGNMGVYRNDNYVVTMRGVSANFWGTEIYNNANRFGRYQSYGTTEVLYNRPGYAASGYPTNRSWDWNVVPGTTTVHTSWKELNAGGHESVSRLPRADEYQANNFAGSLSAGDCGIFAIDFLENAANSWGGPANRYTPTRLAFKKSVFAVNGLLICLGSNIKSAPNVGLRTATNLFQNILSPSVGSLYINSESPTSQDVSTELAQGMDNWLLTPAGTGYFIPANNAIVHIEQGEQTTPNPDVAYNLSPTQYPMITNQAAKAWITHPSTMLGDKYEFVIAPNKTPAQMNRLATELTQRNTYRVLQQNEFAHIVHLPTSSTTAYSIFDAQTDFRTLNTLVNEVDNPCMIITKEIDGKVDFSICSPDVLYNCVVTVNLKGKWTIANLPSSVTNIDSSMPDATTISFDMKDGLPSNVMLISTNPETGIEGALARQMSVLVEKGNELTTILFTNNQDKISYKIFNQAGFLIHSQRDVIPVGNRLQINTSSYPLGLYCVQVVNGDGKVYSKKFMLQ